MKRNVSLLLTITMLLGLTAGAAVAGTATTVPSVTAPKGKLALAWHTAMASRWLDPQEHDGTATPDNFLTAVHDALIKNQGDKLYDHLALAEQFDFAKDANSETFVLRKGIKFHNGDPVTAADVQFSYENYKGAKADVFKQKTERVDIVDDRTIRFHLKEPCLDFPLLFGTSDVTGAAWIVPAKHYQQVGPDRFTQNPLSAGPYKLVPQEPGIKLEFEAFEGYYRPVHIKQLVMDRHPRSHNARGHAGARGGGHHLLCAG